MTELLLTVTQSASLAGVSRQAILYAIEDGRIKAIRIGPRAWAIRKRDLDGFILKRLRRAVTRKPGAASKKGKTGSGAAGHG